MNTIKTIVNLREIERDLRGEVSCLEIFDELSLQDKVRLDKKKLKLEAVESAIKKLLKRGD